MRDLDGSSGSSGSACQPHTHATTHTLSLSLTHTQAPGSRTPSHTHTLLPHNTREESHNPFPASAFVSSSSSSRTRAPVTSMAADAVERLEAKARIHCRATANSQRLLVSSSSRITEHRLLMPSQNASSRDEGDKRIDVTLHACPQSVMRCL